nr:hypothetical protein [Snodgrassella alvi]
MPNKKSHIIQLIKKGYRLPHDIEVVACEIYYSSEYNKLICKNIVNDFINSVVTSKYSNIVEITYDYMSRLIYADGELLYEEFLKVLHLFDSINIFFCLGINESHDVIEKSDVDMVFFLKKYKKWGKNIVTSHIENKQWWQRVINLKDI